MVFSHNIRVDRDSRDQRFYQFLFGYQTEKAETQRVRNGSHSGQNRIRTLISRTYFTSQLSFIVRVSF